MNAPGPLPFPADGHAPAGHRLGHFELRGVAARSDHGIVYRAWDHELGIAVAIKEYLPRQLARRDERGDLQPQGSAAIGAFERGREAFVNEVRLLARCDHPSLLRVRQLLRLHGTVYRVMPWYQGWPLAELRREMAEPPDEPALRRLLQDVLGALETWHRVGGPHGSVNPAKILLLDDDRALLLGPGLARRAAGDGLESPASPFDRPFQAPEQRSPSRQTPCGAWTDFYALAQVIRYCITGMLPQPDAPSAEPLAATVDALYFDAPHVRYDDGFLRVLDAAAAPSPGDRPQTVREFCDWLEHGLPRVPAAARVPAKATEPGASEEKAKADAPVDALDAADAAGPVTAVDPGGPVDIPLQLDSPAQATQAPLADASPAALDTTADTASETASETNFATAPTTASATGSATGSPTGSPTTAAAREEEQVDAATVDLIRRVIEAIPERQAPPPDATAAFNEPLLRIEDWSEPAPPAVPMRSARKGPWWLLGVVLLAAGAFAAWQWGGPAWESLGLMDPPPSTAAAPPGAPSTAEPAAPAAAPALAPPAKHAAAPGSAPVASAAEPAAASSATATTSGATADATAPAAPVAVAAPATPAAPAAPAAAVAPEATAAASAAPASAAAAERLAAPSTASSTAPSAAAPSAQARPNGVASVVVNATPPADPPRNTTERAAVPPPAPRRATPESPRQACGTRTQFALYRCMQQQCAMPAWARHEQCRRLKATDRVE